ncbi:MAG: hypothetical protein QXQ39_06895 [Conexivisphaerales archaeon]
MSVEDFRAVVAEWLSSSLSDIKPREVALPLKPVNIISVIGPR